MASPPGQDLTRMTDVPISYEQSRKTRMRVAVNLLTEDPENPSGAHWFWTRVIPEMAKRLESGEELHLLVSPKSRHLHQGYGPGVFYITYPWSNERRIPRTLSEHFYSPLRLPLGRIDVFNTLMAPLINVQWSLVLHMKTMHAFTEPDAIAPLPRLYRRLNYPRSGRVADAIIINSESLRSEIQRYLKVDASKLKLIYEAVDHDLFKPGDVGTARAEIARYGVVKPFVLFVSSLWPYKNCDGLLRAWALARRELGDRQLAIVGPGRDERYLASLHALAAELGIASDVVFVGGVPLEETVRFYRAADAFVYPSLNETFGLPILEAMACGCPVVTSDTSAMPETAGGAAVLSDPKVPASIARAITEAAGPGRDRLRDQGLQRARQFTWGATAAGTLDVYREAAERRRHGQK
jgi:glycosyltransferase involved in cell wall biosynthesis